jgi:ribose/xylose/arabinose/galactoside ABC-type transport system permease subunit
MPLAEKGSPSPVGGEAALLPRAGSAIREWGILLALVILVAVVALASPSFLTRQNILNILRQVSVVGIIACGMTLVIVSGTIDLSVGSIVSFASVVAVSQILATKSLLVGMALGLLVGIGVGALNGWLIALVRGKIGISFIVTYGMLTVVVNAALLWTNGKTINWEYLGYTNPIYTFIGKGSLWIIPFPVILFLVVAVLSQFLLTRTTFGRTLQHMGYNIEATRLSGLRVGRFRILAHAYVGLLSSIAAIILTARVTAAYPLGGAGYEFDSITAVIVGGTSLSGGKGSVVKTVIGVLLIGVILNAMIMLRINQFFQQAVKGAIILIAVIIDLVTRKER